MSVTNSPDNQILSPDDTTASVTAPAPTDPTPTSDPTQGNISTQDQGVQNQPLDNRQQQNPMGGKDPAQPPQAAAPQAPPPHPAVQKAGILHTIAETLAGGPRFQTSIDANTGEVTRTKLPMSRADIGMAIAMEALGGALGGLTVHGPNAAAQAAEKGFQAGKANRQQELDQEKQQADETYSRQMALTQTNFRMHQNAVQMGQADYGMHQDHVNSYKPTYEALLKMPGAIQADMVPESDLTKYHVTKDMAIPVSTVERIDPKTGHQAVDKYGVPQWDNMYAVVNPDAEVAIGKDDLKTLADYKVPGYFTSDGSPVNLGSNPMVKARLLIDAKSKASAIQIAEQNLNKAQEQIVNPKDSIYSLFPDLNGLANAITAHEGQGENARNMRNNNPGNLKYANQAGATQDKDGFAVFASMQAGKDALIDQLKKYQQRSPSESPESFFSRYSPNSDPGNGPGTSEAYADAVRKASGKEQVGKVDVEPIDVKAAMQKDPSLINAFVDYAKYSGSPMDIAIQKMEADKTIDPQSVGKMVQLVGGQAAIQKIGEKRKAEEDRVIKQQNADIQVAKVKAESDEKLRGQEADDMALAQSAADNNMTSINSIISMRADRRAHVQNLAQKINPNYNPQTAELKSKVWDDFLTDKGKPNQQIKSGNTLFDHIGKALDAGEEYHRTNSPMLNKPLNWWNENVGNDPYLQQLRSAIEPVKTEFMTFLGNNHALTERDKQTGDILASTTMTPLALEQNLKTFAEIAAYRLKETNEGFRRVFENHNFPGLISEDAAHGIEKLTDAKGNNPTRDILKDMDVGGFITGNSKGYGTPGKKLGDVVKTKGSWQPPQGAPPAQGVPDGKVLKQNGQVVAVSKGGQWINPQQ